MNFELLYSLSVGQNSNDAPQTISTNSLEGKQKEQQQ